jgi:hypothetical protein
VKDDARKYNRGFQHGILEMRIWEAEKIHIKYTKSKRK